MTRARPAAFALALLLAPLLAMPPLALAQGNRGGITTPFDPGRPLMIRIPEEPPGSARDVPPLDPVQASLVRQAQLDRQMGRLDEARRILASLPAASQHHPAVLTERARLELAAGNWSEVVRFGTEERRTQHDSLLVGHEVVEAYERLSRPRDASLVAVEAWAAAPAEEGWANDVLRRLAPVDQHAGRDALRRAVAREPLRPDLARGLALLEWQGGDLHAALKALRPIEHADRGPRQRWGFGESLLVQATSRDSAGACEVFFDIASDTEQDAAYRTSAARRYWQLLVALGRETQGAAKLYSVLKDVPVDRWSADLTLPLARALRESGDTGAARALLGIAAANPAALPEVALERSLADLRDGPPERALAGLKADTSATDLRRFHYAEALFFAGLPDSAKGFYERVSRNPSGEYAGAALERLFLIEDAQPRSALPALGRIAYEQWRGASRRALTLAESLWVALPRGPVWAQTAMIVSDERDRLGDAHGAVVAALALADSLPDDRLAPLARQRAGDLYATKLKDEPHAIEQYEACVARYPRAWNAPEVRRRLDELRRTRRF